MEHARGRRWVAGAIATTMVAGVLSLLAMSPAVANHGSMVLEVSREVETVTTGQTVTLTARLQTPQGTPTIDGSGGETAIDFELFGINADGEGGADSPLTPDRTCTTTDGSALAYPTCTVQVTSAVAGTLFVRAWVDEDGSNATAEADSTEGRLSSADTDCNTEAENPPAANTGREEACLEGPEQPGDNPEEPDDTDVVQVNFRSPAGVPTVLDCAPNTPAPAKPGAAAFVSCRVTDGSGSPMPGIQVDGENLATIQNPDEGDDDDPADYNGAPTAEDPACVTGPSGVCNVRIEAISAELGAAMVCFWVDSDPGVDGTDATGTGLFVNPSYDPESAGSTDGGGCPAEPAPGAADDGGLTDKENVDFQQPVLTSIDVEPDRSTRQVGTQHTLTARLLDQFGRQWETGTQVRFEFLSGSTQDNDGSTPGIPDRICNTPGGTGADPGTCSVSYSSGGAGTDTICGFFGTTSATCSDEPQATDSVANVDLVTQQWTPVPTTPTTTPAAEDVARTQGYTLVGADGGIFTYGTSTFHGSTGDLKLNRPIIGMASKKGGTGYWLVASDGGIFSFGDAEFFGSMGDQRLNAPVLGMEATPSGKGYFLFAADGGIFTFGDARFKGSTGDQRLNQPVVGMAVTEKGDGYWLVARDGGIFSFNAPFHGSTGDIRLNEPIFDMGPRPGDGGYWLVARDGGIFTFGNAEFHNSAVGATTAPVIGLGVTPTGKGYWVADSRGAVFPFGDARFLGDRRSAANNATTVGFATVPKA